MAGVDPKGAVGLTKLPMHLLPPPAMAHLVQALADGAKKYGPYNWRSTEVLASIYVSAIKRHLDAWFDGEELSRDAGVHHLAHAMAGLAIMLDAKECGTLVDDRPPSGRSADMQHEYAERKSNGR